MEQNPALATSDEIAAAYLEWLDDATMERSRESMLLAALRAESDCVRALEVMLAKQIVH